MTKKRKHTQTVRCPDCGTVWGVRPDEDVECPKCDYARDRKMRKAKRIREEEFQVTTVDRDTQNGEVSKKVSAADAKTAIQKAALGNQDVNSAEELVVTQTTNAGAPTTRQTTPTSKVGKEPGASVLTGAYESTKFRYDYKIGLPNGFAEFVRKTKGRTKGLLVEQRKGRVYMTVESPEAMDKLMAKLKKASRSKTVETRDKAKTLIRGILGSVK